METIKMAVLGLNHGSKMARHATDNPEVDLVAVAGFGDHDVKLANELNVPIFSDYTLLLKQVPLDAVYIALPNTLHVEAVEKAIEAGVKNILLEKPIANTVEEGKHVIKICKDAGVTLLIGHHRRSSSKYQFLRKLIDSGRLGKIIAIQSRYCIAKDEDCFDREWYVTKGVGGPLLINAIHDFDDLNFITGKDPVKVYATTRNTIRGNDAEDSASVLIEYDGVLPQLMLLLMAHLVLGIMTWQLTKTNFLPWLLAKIACKYSVPRDLLASRIWICTTTTMMLLAGLMKCNMNTLRWS